MRKETEEIFSQRKVILILFFVGLVLTLQNSKANCCPTVLTTVAYCKYVNVFFNIASGIEHLKQVT